MFLKKVLRKFRNGFRTLRSEGLLEFLIKTLQSFKKKMSQTVAPQLKSKIGLVVKYEDLEKADISQPIKPWKGTNRKSLRLNWIMPPPGKGSGGHMNIFRFIRYAEQAGHENRIYLYADAPQTPIPMILEQMGDSYPNVKAKMTWLNNNNEMREADAIFCTSWETAYPSFNSSLDAKRFYFVQDFEPFFFPVGSLSVLAENTYKFGFHGVTAGRWLATKLSKEYGMATDHFDFGADTSLYNYTNAAKRKEIFFYARPYTARRGFEMGIAILDLFHKKHPEYIINLAGWDVSDYEIPFPYVNLKTLEIGQLNELYNRCAAGLVLSLTNMSLLPLELLASGTIPVVNNNENNTLVSDNKFIAYANNDPVSLARKLSEIVSMDNLPEYARQASQSVGGDSWDISGKKFVSIIEKRIRNK